MTEIQDMHTVWQNSKDLSGMLGAALKYLRLLELRWQAFKLVMMLRSMESENKKEYSAVTKYWKP
jgi:hypothetical protein